MRCCAVSSGASRSLPTAMAGPCGARFDIPGSCWRSPSAPSSSRACCSRRSRRLLPVRGYRPDPGLHDRAGRCLLRRDGRPPVGLGRGHPPGSRRGLGHVDRRGGNAAATVNSGRIFIMLRDKPERTDSAQQVIARLRRATASVPGIKRVFPGPRSRSTYPRRRAVPSTSSACGRAISTCCASTAR